jgi:hypothetical protein
LSVSNVDSARIRNSRRVPELLQVLIGRLLDRLAVERADELAGLIYQVVDDRQQAGQRCLHVGFERDRAFAPFRVEIGRALDRLVIDDGAGLPRLLAEPRDRAGTCSSSGTHSLVNPSICAIAI